jgi:hypothetical protein
MVFSGHIIENFNSLLKNGFENFHIIETRFSLLRNGLNKYILLKWVSTIKCQFFIAIKEKSMASIVLIFLKYFK